MAVTKIYAIHSRLDNRMAYAVNERKSGLGGAIEYTVSRSLAPSRFYADMRKMGYELKLNVKYPAVRPPGTDKMADRVVRETMGL